MDYLTKEMRPDFIVKGEILIEEVSYNGCNYAYTLMRKESGPPNLPGFVTYALGKNGKKYLGISEEVPAIFRQFFLIHEIIEFDEFTDQTGRCLEALKKELGLVPKEIKKIYIEYRREFFKNLVKFQATNPDKDFRAEIKASADYLETL